MTWEVTQAVDFEVNVFFYLKAKAQNADYGVPQSPVWTEYDDHDFEDAVITICGVDVEVNSLPKTLQDAILEAAIDACDDGKWGCYE